MLHHLRPVLGATFAALLTSCGSPTRAPSVAPPAPATVTVWLERSENWITTRFVATLPSKADAFVQGGSRFTLSPDGRTVKWGADRLLSEIVLAREVSGGWVFVGADGSVLRSGEFLGPLSRLGSLPSRVATTFAGRGRVAVISQQGEVFATNGTEPIARMMLPGGAKALTGAFATPLRGAAITEGGGLLATADGGASWQAVPLGRDAAWRFDLAGETLVVTSTRGLDVLQADATLGAVPAGLSADTGANWLPGATLHRESYSRGLSDAEEQTIALSRWARFPDSARFESNVIIDRNGEGLFADLGELVAFNLATGQKQPAPRAMLPEDRGCALMRWGERRALDCSDGSPSSSSSAPRLQVSSAGADFSPLPDFPARGYLPTAFSSDGERAAWVGRCGADEVTSSDRLCAYRRGTPARDIELDFETDEVQEVRGPNALVLGEAADESSVFALVNLDTGRTTRLAAEGATIETLGFAGPLALAGAATVDGGAEQTVLIKGGLDGTFARHPLPERASRVGFLDAQRGIAVGDLLSDLWFTEDGGERWTLAPAAVAGSSAGVALDHEWIACENEACQVGGVALIRWGGAAASTGSAFVNEHAPTTASEEADPMTPPMALADACELKATPAAALAALPPVASATARVVPLDLGARRARLVVDGPATTLAWQLEPATKVLESSPTKLDWPDGHADIRLLAANKRGALVTRCERFRGRACQVLRAEPGKPVKVIATLDAFEHPSNLQAQPVGWLSQDGSGAVLFASDRGGVADDVLMPKLDVAIAFRSDGTVSERRSFAWTAGARMRSGLVVRGGVASYMVNGPAVSGDVLFFGLDGRPGEAKPVTLSNALPTCGAEVATSDQLIIPLGTRPAGLELANASAGVLTVELNEAGPCFRSFETASADSSDAPPAGPEAIMLLARGGALTAGIARRDGFHAAECVRPTP